MNQEQQTFPARSACPISVDGAGLYGEWIGERQDGKPVLVFLHDGLGSIETWRRFPDLLCAGLGLPGFAYDRWGYGRSDKRERFPHRFMEDAAERLPKILDHAGIDDCVLVGHSDGGSIALLHGARNERRVRAIVAIAAHVHCDEKTYGQMLRHRKMVEEDAVPDWMRRFHGERAAHLLLRWTEAWIWLYENGWDISDDIRPGNGPVIAIQGLADSYGLPDNAELIKQAIPQTELVMLEGVDHFPHIEATDRVLGLVTDFVLPHLRGGAAV